MYVMYIATYTNKNLLRGVSRGQSLCILAQVV